MPTPYYSDEYVTLYLGDCREVTEWLEADVLVTDPPYGIAWKRGTYKDAAKHGGIKGDKDTSARDAVVEAWGSARPALVFGSMRAPFPDGWRQSLVFRKPEATASGMFGAFLPWRNDWEPVFVLGADWPKAPSLKSGVVATSALSAGGYRGYATETGHPHTKPIDVMQQLIDACPSGAIADPFAGSGSTLVAAKRLGRKAIGVEIDERYCEIAARRLAQGVLDFGAVS